jgi:hypothetical protein
MRRLIVAAAVVAASMLFPMATLADAPYRAYISGAGGAALADQPAAACLGSAGSFEYAVSSVSDNGNSTLSAQTSDKILQAHVHGTEAWRFWTTLGDQDAPHLYDGSIDLRINDIVTDNFPTVGPPQGYVSHPVVIDMIPVGGGPAVRVATDIQVWVVWYPDDTIFVTFGLGLVSCA